MSLTVRFWAKMAEAKQKTTVNRKILKVLEIIFSDTGCYLKKKQNGLYFYSNTS
jgi:hypothetical protein